MFATMGVRVDRLLDVASGVGTTARIFLDTLSSQKIPMPDVVCLDESVLSLCLTGQNLLEILPEEKMGLVCQRIQEATGLARMFPNKEPFDLATWGNGIHYLSPEDQRSALCNIRDNLRPGGFLGISTAFHQEAIPEETKPFYKAHISGAVRILREKGIERDKTVPSPEAARYRPASHYRELLSDVGFKVVSEESFLAMTTADFWRGLSDYDQYASGALHGYPLESAREVLVSAVDPAFEQCAVRGEDGQLGISRNWLSLFACRRS